jgi:uncharacterized membrane protein YphA (DoxX/SURF4 family)
MRNNKKNLRGTIALWSLQVLLAALFLMAGSMKLITAGDVLAQQSPLPIGLLRFIGVAEVLGALGLILPGLFRVRRELTPLAAAGLVIIMVGATIISVSSGFIASGVPFIVGVCCATVAYFRRPARTRQTQLMHPAH